MTVTASPSSSPSPTPLEQLDALLNEDTGLLAEICSEAEQLLSVGWPPGLVPGLITGKSLGTSGMIHEFQLEKLEDTGVKLEKAVEIAMARC